MQPSNKMGWVTELKTSETRGLWTALPALIKVKETGQINQYFYVEKILNWRNFAGKSKMCVHSYSFLAQKALFLPPL